MEPLRIGVLGASRIAVNALVAPARELGHRLVAVAARDRDRAEDFAATHGVERVLDDYAAVVSDPEVEVVYNPLPNALHGPWNLAAVAAGKHVVSEKPFAANAEEAAEVRDAAAKAGVVVMEAFHYAFHPLTRRLHALLDSGELGELRRVEAAAFIPPPPADDIRWSLPLAGGALMDVGCYALHAALMLAPWAGGTPRVVAARGRERAGAPQVDEWLEAELAFPDGAVGRAECRMAGEEVRWDLRVVGTRGEARAANFVAPHQDDRLVVRTEQGGERVERTGRRPTYSHMWEAFAARLRQGTPLPIDTENAVTTMALIDDCYRAAGLSPRPRHTPA